MNKMTTIKNLLEKQKKNLYLELEKIIQSIEKKKTTLIKMRIYLNEYQNFDRFALCHQTPVLNKNLVEFSNKLIEIIAQAARDLESFENGKSHVISKIKAIENKISLLKKFEVRDQAIIDKKHDQIESTALDDLSLVKLLGEEHE